MGIISISLDPFIVFSEKSQGPIIENSKKSSNVSIGAGRRKGRRAHQRRNLQGILLRSAVCQPGAMERPDHRHRRRADVPLTRGFLD